MIAGILAFLQALPRILALMEQVGKWITANNFNGFMDNLEKRINELEAADTNEKKLEAAKKLADLIRNI